MYTGKTLFAQLMDFLPWTTFTRIVDRYGGNVDASLYTLLQVFSVTLFEKIPLNADFFDTKHILEYDMISNQLNLFNN